MRVLGIDSGLAGGLAVLEQRVPLYWHSMPVRKVGKRKQIDVHKLAELVQFYKPVHVVLEQQRHTGAAINFGKIYAACQLAVPSAVVHVVHPRTWQTLVSNIDGTPKERSIQWCKQRKLPVPNLTNGKQHDGIADAWCIAWWFAENEEYKNG
jgi:hypothetical protein